MLHFLCVWMYYNNKISSWFFFLPVLPQHLLQSRSVQASPQAPKSSRDFCPTRQTRLSPFTGESVFIPGRTENPAGDPWGLGPDISGKHLETMYCPGLDAIRRKLNLISELFGFKITKHIAGIKCTLSIWVFHLQLRLWGFIRSTLSHVCFEAT